MNHLSKKSEAYDFAKQTRLINPILAPHTKEENTARFPEKHLENLLENGFRIKGRQDFPNNKVVFKVATIDAIKKALGYL